MEAKAKEPSSGGRMIVRRRRVPRRDFFGRIGLLVRGQYYMNRAVQIGEGGMMVNCAVAMQVGQQLVLTFKLPGLMPEVVMGCVRYILPEEKGRVARYGIEFLNLDFNVKREVRNYVAQNNREIQNEEI